MARREPKKLCKLVRMPNRGTNRLCVEKAKYGYSGWLYAKNNRDRLPVSIGKPRTIRQAMRNAVAFLVKVEGN